MRKLDAGHGGSDPGAIFKGRKEKDDNLVLGLAVGKILSEQGIDVRYTRTDDTYNTPLEKANMGNDADADLFISIHRNAMPIPNSASGIESLVYENSGIPALLARNINSQLEAAGFINHGVSERPGLVVLRRTNMPAVLVEAGFIDNDADNRFFDANLNGIAQAVADGILKTIAQQEAATPEYYQVQTGAYRAKAPAQQQLKKLESQGFPAFIINEDGYYKVRVGAFTNLDNAVRMEQVLRKSGYPTLIVKEQRVR